MPSREKLLLFGPEISKGFNSKKSNKSKIVGSSEKYTSNQLNSVYYNCAKHTIHRVRFIIFIKLVISINHYIINSISIFSSLIMRILYTSEMAIDRIHSYGNIFHGHYMYTSGNNIKYIVYLDFTMNTYASFCKPTKGVISMSEAVSNKGSCIWFNDLNSQWRNAPIVLCNAHSSSQAQQPRCIKDKFSIMGYLEANRINWKLVYFYNEWSQHIISCRY